jgi:hypothetical protein
MRKVERAQRIGTFAVAQGAVGEQFAAMQQEQAIRDGGRFGEVVGGEQNGGLLPRQGADRGPEMRRGGGVEAARRFVEQSTLGRLTRARAIPSR